MAEFIRVGEVVPSIVVDTVLRCLVRQIFSDEAVDLLEQRDALALAGDDLGEMARRDAILRREIGLRATGDG